MQYCSLVTVMQQPLNRLSLAREIAFPVIAVVGIVGYADIRMPLGLPGHRGLIWLTVLVAVALMTHRRETVIAVGAASTAATVMMHVAGPSGSARYLMAGVLLYAVAAVPVVRRRRWFLVLAAAPIHLVALAGSISVGIGEKVLFHLAFGLAAGLLGGAVAFGMGERLWGTRRKENVP